MNSNLRVDLPIISLVFKLLSTNYEVCILNKLQNKKLYKDKIIIYFNLRLFPAELLHLFTKSNYVCLR